MDLSSLPEAQQQQLQQLQQQFHQHQQQQQQQQQQQSYNNYDYSQQHYHHHPQAQDQTQAHSYYDNNNNYHQYPQYSYPYYQPDYSNTYQPPAQAQAQAQGQVQARQRSPVELPPGVSAPVATEPVLPMQGGSGSGGSGGFNAAAAAAIAALNQLNQFAGKMDAAERAMAGVQVWGGSYGSGGGMMHAEGGYYSGGGRQFSVRGAGRSPYRGGGGRGGGRGSVGQRQVRPDGSSPKFRGKGRGRGGGRRLPQNASSSLNSNQGNAQVEELPSGSAALVADQGGKLQIGADVSQGQVTKPVQTGWCEICRVDCTTQEILEQHKNGKKHAKNFKKFQESQNSSQLLPIVAMTTAAPVPIPTSLRISTPEHLSVPEMHSEQKNASKSNPEVKHEFVHELESQSESSLPIPNVENDPKSALESQSEFITKTEKVEEGEKNITQSSQSLQADAINEDKMETDTTVGEHKSESNATVGENKGETVVAIEENKVEFDATVEETKVESDAQNKVEVKQAEGAHLDSRKRNFDRFNTRGRGRGRGRGRFGNTRGREKDRGANKRVKTFERPPPRPVPPLKEVPVVCDLCNVTCDTQAVFQCHLAGKKHAQKVKRFHGHQQMYGSVGLQALYPPNSNVQPHFIPQGQYQQPQYPHPHYQQPSMYVPQGSYPHQAHQATAYDVPHQALQIFDSQGAQVTQDGSQREVAAVDPGGHQGAIGI